MKYILILIVSMTSNGAALQVENIEFNSKSDCQEALIKILNGYEKDPISATFDDARVLSRMHVDGWCVAKGDD